MMEYHSGQGNAGPPTFKQSHPGFNSNGLVHVDTDDLTYVYKNKLSSDRSSGFNDVISSKNPTNIPGDVSIDDFDIIGTNDEIVFLSETKAPSQNQFNSRFNSTHTNNVKDPLQACNNYMLNSQLNPSCTFETKTPSQSTNNYPLNPTYTYETRAPFQLCYNMFNLTNSYKTNVPSQPCNNYLLNTTNSYETNVPSQLCNDYLLNPTNSYETNVPSQPCNNYLLNTKNWDETNVPSHPCHNYLLNPSSNPTYMFETKAPSQSCNNYMLNPTNSYGTKVLSQPCHNYLLNPPLNSPYTYETKALSQPCNNYPFNPPLNPTYMYEIKDPSHPCNNFSLNPRYTYDQGPDNRSFLDGIDDGREQYVSKEVSSNSTLENPSPPISPLHTNPIKNMPPLCPYPQLNGLDSYVTKTSITDNDQGLTQPCRKRTRKPSKPKDKTSTDKVLKIVSAAELESDDEWLWDKYGQKKLAKELHRSYYKCAAEICEATRHVDKRNSDPNTYIVTYFGQHNHSPSTYTSTIKKRRKYVKMKKEIECLSN
ncbi:hypothetical protein POM88_036088 [Heracleum sosnowskyi]|uniref:WRKY domain-containing protein n=1 Tax=Heracleum sosnowskyi TaxID=360622 RepID=A0AAD8HMR2_9APIA|nr:hypothetical protein POM88_036088 [Heracleum sosnowskyi]